MAILSDLTVDTLGTATRGGGLKFITGYRYISYMLKMLNNVTFLYDPSWQLDTQTGSVDLPIAFFSVVKMNEIMTTEVQTKKVLFYNSQSNTSANVAQGSTVNIIADNIVTKPKSYKLDVIVPYDDLTMMFNSSVLTGYQQTNIISEIYGGGSSGTSYAYAVTTTETVRKMLSMLLSTLASLTNASSVATWIENATSVPMYNKNSLEKMWRNRSVLKMKLWNGWKFVYVAVTDFDISKESTEDGVEHATITCTELPIMVMHTKKDTVSASSKFASFCHGVLDGIETASGVTIKAVAKTISGGW